MARKKLYEGKAKIIYEGPEPGTVIQHFKDDATAFNAEKKAVIEGKGVINNRISEFLFQRLAELKVPTHFLKTLNMREQLVLGVEIIPIEVIVRNVACGSICKRLGLDEGDALPRALVEYCYKSDELGDPLISEEHISVFGWAQQAEMDDIYNLALRINDICAGVFSGAGLQLIDIKLEFGRLIQGEEMRIVLADEISPDTCRLWDRETKKRLDKDRFRHDMGEVAEAYQEVARRLSVLS